MAAADDTMDEREAGGGSPAPHTDALSNRWRDLAALLRAHAVESAARAYERAADDLDRALASASTETLTLRQAAAESGYSSDHLGRLVREGRIPNAGRPNAPRIARRDLPLKATRPAEVADSAAGRHPSNRQIVQSIIDRGVA